MKITALEEYGLRCMLMLARRGSEMPVTLPEISMSEGITLPYAGKLLMNLRQAGLVKAVRGRNGGYVLSRPPEKTNLKEIFEALGEPLGTGHHCGRYSGNDGVCVHLDDCTIKDILKTFGSFISVVSEKITLSELAQGKLQLTAPFGTEGRGAQTVG